MLRIFVTGDNHIGKKYDGHTNGAVLASARIEALDGMVAAANAEDCALFIICGDLFENVSQISKQTVNTVADKLSAFEGTVVILPGNHDFYNPEQPLWRYLESAVSDKNNILLLTQPRTYTLTAGESEVVLYPAICTEKHSGTNSLGWIRDAQIVPDGTFRLGLAHGAVEGESLDKEGQYYKMTRQELQSIPVDVWLIGHTHVPFPRELTEQSAATNERIFNAGTHVQTDVHNNTEGLCFVLELDDTDGQKPVRAKKLVSGTVRFCRRTLKLEPERMEELLAAGLADLPDNTSVDLELEGAVSADEYARRAACCEAAGRRFTEFTYHDGNVTKLLTRELIAEEYPETSFAAALLTELMAEPKEAQLLHDMLQEMKGGR